MTIKKQSGFALRSLSFSLLLPMLASASIEEKKVADLASKLKPIADSQWKEIAGSKSSEIYEVQKGDTLWGVSQRLFGDGRYWPKIWAINNIAMNDAKSGGIGNPHELSPGLKISFTPGSSTSLPVVAAANAPAAAPAEPAKPAEAAQTEPVPAALAAKNKAHPEYENVSPDLWKPVEVAQREASRKSYDEYGIETDIKIRPEIKLTIRVPVMMNESAIPWLGEVVGSRREGSGLAQNEVLFIKSDSQDLQVGTTYSVLTEPSFVDEKKSDRTGYMYRSNGEVKIIGIKDQMYIGIISKSYDVIRRGDRLYPLLPMITDIKPQAASESVEALALLNPLMNTWSSGQNHFIHFDRGLEDGVQVGNVFRIYEYLDPTTRKKLTESDMLINADAIVVHVTAQYSTALIIRSKNLVKNGDFGVLLTDIRDFAPKSKDKSRDFGVDKQKEEESELDDLEKLDQHNASEGAGKQEKEEVKELEKWDHNKGAEEPVEETKPAPKEAPVTEAPPSEPAQPEQIPSETQSLPQTPSEAVPSEPAPATEGSNAADSALDAPATDTPPAAPSTPAPSAPSAPSVPSTGTEEPSIDPMQINPSPTQE